MPEGAGTQATTLVGADRLAELVAACFSGLGVPADDASAVADVFVAANLRGTDSHGILRVPVNMRRVRAGLAGGTGGMAVVSESGVLCRLDARHALGAAAAIKATDRAIALAHEHGAGVVALDNATNFGIAGYYAERVARAEMAGVVFSNSSRAMAPYGAKDAFVGTNPLAIAVPLGRRGEFVLDMSSSVIARGAIRRAEVLGEEIPEGLAIDSDGYPTTDPTAALAGTMLPLGGPKGSGLAFAISLLVVALAGAELDDELTQMYLSMERPQRLGQAFIAIDFARLGGREATIARFEALIDRLHALEPAPGFDAVLHAGESGARCARERRANGIPIDDAELIAVEEACRECGIPEVAEEFRALRAGG